MRLNLERDVRQRGGNVRILRGGLGIPLHLTFRSFLVYWAPIIVYCSLIYLQSSFPSPVELPDLPYADKFLHGIMYAVLGMLFFRAYRTLKIKNNLNLLIVLSVASSTLYGISDEIHQAGIAYRSAEIMDALADFVGSIVGVVAYRCLIPAKRLKIGGHKL